MIHTYFSKDIQEVAQDFMCPVFGTDMKNVPVWPWKKAKYATRDVDAVVVSLATRELLHSHLLPLPCAQRVRRFLRGASLEPFASPLCPPDYQSKEST